MASFAQFTLPGYDHLDVTEFFHVARCGCRLEHSGHVAAQEHVIHNVKGVVQEEEVAEDLVQHFGAHDEQEGPIQLATDVYVVVYLFLKAQSCDGSLVDGPVSC